MLEKKVTYDHSITEDGVIQVRKITRIMENDKELGKSYFRKCIAPGDNYEDEDHRTKKIAKAIFTEELVLEYQAMIAANAALLNP